METFLTYSGTIVFKHLKTTIWEYGNRFNDLNISVKDVNKWTTQDYPGRFMSKKFGMLDAQGLLDGQLYIEDDNDNLHGLLLTTKFTIINDQGGNLLAWCNI